MTAGGGAAVGAVVLDGDYRGLGIVRSLGRQGIETLVVHGDATLATHSKYCSRAVRWPGPSPEQHLAFLIELADRHGLGGWVVFPTTDEEAWQVSRQSAMLSEFFRLTTPPWGVFSVAADKRRLGAVAASIGVETPRSWLPRTVAEVEQLEVPYPVVLKPTKRQSLNDLTSAKAWRVDDHDELVRRWRDAAALVGAEDLLVQELIPGGGNHQLSYAAVCVRGRPRLSVTARRARQWPPDFGRASTYVETVERPDVTAAATRLLAALEIDGLVEVEFKQDPRDGVLKLLDVNARVWGWHSIGDAAGVDFAHGAYLLALGADVPVRTGTPGVRWARLAIDVPASARAISGGDLGVAEYLWSLRPGLHGPVAARDDMLPAVVELPLLARASRRGQVHRRQRSEPNRPAPAPSMTR
ncbi:MAG: D-aspartate ligase [Pseudonocardiales bacterium]|jgi:predicted ATP-grasp superfamily ATP-dependent carboligase|nr:D-aspartate ligase [Pseudonocardiales bacterium]